MASLGAPRQHASCIQKTWALLGSIRRHVKACVIEPPGIREASVRVGVARELRAHCGAMRTPAQMSGEAKREG